MLSYKTSTQLSSVYIGVRCKPYGQMSPVAQKPTSVGFAAYTENMRLKIKSLIISCLCCFGVNQGPYIV